MTPATRARVRALFARECAAPATTVSLGCIRLRASQSDAIRRAHLAIARFGGVLIANDVGTGKTFIALGVMASYKRPLVLAPASLRSMWHDAAERTGVDIRFFSLESLPSLRARPLGHDVVVVDEAHHVRNPRTKRYAVVREIAAGAHVVLMSGTPLHNGARDVESQLALFLGHDAGDVDDETRANAVVRGSDVTQSPAVVVHPPIPIADAHDVVHSLTTLPAPVAARDGGTAPALIRIGFLRAWCSSHAAATAMARRASHRARALLDAMRAGMPLTGDDLRTWMGAGEDQIGFTELLSRRDEGPGDPESGEAYATAVDALRQLLRAHEALDDERAAYIADIRRRHSGVPVLACAQYAATVEAMWKRLRMSPGVAVITSRGGRIASGSVSRDEVLARFAPIGTGAASPHDRERVTLLLSTDLVSEGLNLQDAGAIIHLDLPWTAARLAQRVGRIARAGSPHATVHTYAISPPRASAALLELERRIETKRRLASGIVGGAQRMGALLGHRRGKQRDAAPDAMARVIELLRPFAVADARAAGPIACGISAEQDGWLALVNEGGHHRLVARIARRQPSTDPARVATCVQWLTEGEEHWLPVGWEAMQAQAERWIERQRGRVLSGAFRGRAARVHSRALGSLMTAVAGAAPHERARAAIEASMPRADLRHASPADTSLVALVVFCRCEESS